MNFLLTKEQKDIVMAAKEFAQGEFPDRAQEFDRTETFDLLLWEKASELGFVGMFIPEEYGGPGFGFFDFCLVNEEFWAVDPGCAQAILSTTFGSEMIILFGTEEQKKTYLPEVCTGKAIIAASITEPDAGSDPTQATTSAVKDGDSWVINGSKMFTTNGNVATYVLTFCVTDAEHAKRHNRFSFILIPTKTPGYEANKIKGKLGIRASNTSELSLSNVRVPVENLIGQEGRGFHQLMEFFNRTRLHIAAQGVGLARGAMERAIRHVKARKQFGRTLASNQAIQFKLAEMATRIEAGRNMYYKASWLVDNGIIKHDLIAMAKWYTAETAVWVASEALHMHGGYGYIDEYDVQRFYRDAKILEIYEGTREMEKTIVAKGLL
jgi:alkylation response protein AidB-like acyl-CoA dehydrogenase